LLIKLEKNDGSYLCKDDITLEDGFPHGYAIMDEGMMIAKATMSGSIDDYHFIILRK